MKQQNNSLTIRIEDLLVFESLTERQNEFFSKWDNHEVQVLYGSAGTGKTFISFYKANEEVLDKGTHVDTLVILRSAVPSRDIGHFVMIQVKPIFSRLYYTLAYYFLK